MGTFGGHDDGGLNLWVTDWIDLYEKNLSISSTFGSARTSSRKYAISIRKFFAELYRKEIHYTNMKKESYILPLPPRRQILQFQ